MNSATGKSYFHRSSETFERDFHLEGHKNQKRSISLFRLATLQNLHCDSSPVLDSNISKLILASNFEFEVSKYS